MQSSVKMYPAKPTHVYLYVTCLVDSFSADTGLDAIALLEREGVEVVVVPEQTCCGQPAYNSGYRDQARAVAEAQMALFPEPWPIVILSGSCGGMMRKHYEDLMPDNQNLATFTERVFEFSEFMVHVLNVKLQDVGAPTRVTLHTSCAGRREMGIHESGLQLIKQLANVEPVAHERQTECCGFGGTFSVKQADISSAMAQDKAASLSATNAPEFVSTDWGCMLNINTTLEYQKSPLRGRHLASFLAERTQPAKEPS
ncbi:(Fe-S)-binding protein [Simiduia sp. 21SJ11W-1]|uniref:(Fe-S)-binding protein n=1 Tax=Simiduia sp. 21SJ11W-1 TaxID=2909669 RepID=UPI00209E4FA6|nr:(Fe-S)-binding protein [Simiduia sp. 21SJ11W-1]UTA48364.1 (Fe-S)-binding protein [Simiduia sp. 21SJ11W-1]